jgi:hypothetical protein
MTNTMNTSSFSTAPSTRTAGIGTSTTQVWYIGRGELVRVVCLTKLDGKFTITAEWVSSPVRARRHYVEMLKPHYGNAEQFKPLAPSTRETIESWVSELTPSANYKTYWMD